MNGRKEKIFLAYEVGHTVNARTVYERDPKTIFIVFNLWTERAFRAESIPCVSITNYITLFDHPRKCFKKANAIAHQWYRLPALSAFSYKDVSLGETLELPIELYFELLLKYKSWIEGILAQHDVAEIIVPHSLLNISDTAAPLAVFEVQTIVNAAIIVAQTRDCTVITLGQTPTVQSFKKSPVLIISRFLLGVLNTLSTLFGQRSSIKVFASADWKNIGPLINAGNSIELVLMDRSQIREISIREILKHRIRFHHPSEVSDSVKSNHGDLSCMQQWSAIESALSTWFTDILPEVPWCFISPIFEYIYKDYSYVLMKNINSIEYLYKKHNNSLVITRASISAQPHFFLLGAVAYNFGIPAIELQHGIETYAPHSLFSRLKIGYIAAYGERMCQRMRVNHGYESERCLAIGSPRFDRYSHKTALTDRDIEKRKHALGLQKKQPVVLCAIPGEGEYLYPSYFNQYEIRDFLLTIRAHQKIHPRTQYVFKFRKGYLSNHYRDLVRELFPDGGIACIDDQFIEPLFEVSSVFITPRSTLMYEATLAGVPSIIYPVKFEDKEFIDSYKIGFAIPNSQEELISILQSTLSSSKEAKKLVDRANKFLEENYSFSGNDSQKLYEMLLKLKEAFPAHEST